MAMVSTCWAFPRLAGLMVFKIFQKLDHHFPSGSLNLFPLGLHFVVGLKLHRAIGVVGFVLAQEAYLRRLTMMDD